ncbi:MAG: SRPBCC family protein [Pseudomonadota bacterium]
MASFKDSIAIRASKQRVYDVVSDFGRYPEFLPEVEKVKVISKTKTRAKAAFTVNMVKKINYTLDFKLSPPNSITWTLVEGEFMESNNGSWAFTSLDKNLTDVVFSIDIGFPFWVPQTLAEGAINSSMPGMIKNIKLEAEKCHCEERK